MNAIAVNLVIVLGSLLLNRYLFEFIVPACRVDGSAIDPAALVQQNDDDDTEIIDDASVPKSGNKDCWSSWFGATGGQTERESGKGENGQFGGDIEDDQRGSADKRKGVGADGSDAPGEKDPLLPGMYGALLLF